MVNNLQTKDVTHSNNELITLAGGCFWCTQAIFKRLRGVNSVASGYSGGKLPNPTYEAVSTGTTGHAESIEIEFDPSIISLEKILTIFFALHDPTTKDRQGDDVGSQYRSAIFYRDEGQKMVAEKVMAEIQTSGKFTKPLVTELSPFTAFYPAEHHHQDFYENNPGSVYCRLVIDPKIKKLLSLYRSDVKSEFLLEEKI